MVMKRTAKAWARLVRKVSRKYPLKKIVELIFEYNFNMKS